MFIPTDILQPLQNITLLRTDHGNVIARDDRDNQEFVFAECNSPAIAGCILAIVRIIEGEKDDGRH
ncbi:hypothetical protein [Pantoea cypripedii]|uniref:TraS protein n=1 Tax=Pantoea cypripedii TaxID=55209 RepID=A0A1X1EMZ0_PANCY|nr:hypothetical protein [Pantoea cypripedii]MBP2199223.1 hypothetical protein [Pantoea cypripedii]ORM90192.1 hypothetical protein HA50_27000 [Pantoea cypripedii]